MGNFVFTKRLRGRKLFSYGVFSYSSTAFPFSRGDLAPCTRSARYGPIDRPRYSVTNYHRIPREINWTSSLDKEIWRKNQFRYNIKIFLVKP